MSGMSDIDDIEALDDYICDAIMAARHGSHDGMPVLFHLERLLAKFRALRAALPDHDAQVRAEALAPIEALVAGEPGGDPQPWIRKSEIRAAIEAKG